LHLIPLSLCINVFYADDDEDDQQIFKEIVSDFYPDIQLWAQHNGAELLGQLGRCSELPAVIFLDLNMPVKNGLDTLAEIRSSAMWMDLPVIIFSTTSNPDIIARSKALGANLYVIKPTSYSVLKETLCTLLATDWSKKAMSLMTS